MAVLMGIYILGFYTSLRNESFIFDPLKKVNEYPKNEKG